MKTHNEIAASEEQWPVPAEMRLALLALLSTDPTATATMSYDEFLAWADEDKLAEWVGGRVIMTSPASRRHQDLVHFLSDVLSAYAQTHGLGAVIIAPFQMHLPASGREPDVLFVAAEHQDRIHATRLDGPADLVIEVISPESRGRDRGEKYYEYQEGGVGEYWLIDPDTQRAEFYQLDAAGLYQTIPHNSDGIYHSRALAGLWVRLAWFWQEPLPQVNRIMLEIVGAAYAQRLIADLKDGGFLS